VAHLRPSPGPRLARTLALALTLAVLALPSPADAATAAQLAERYALAGVTTEGRAWSAKELDILGDTLAALSPAERRALRGVSIVRAPSSRRGRAREAGLFVWGADGRQIYVYDRAFTRAGTPNWTIVHEIGHAITFQPFLEESNRHKAVLERFNAAVTHHNTLISDYNAAVRRYNARNNAADKRALEQLRPRIERAAKNIKTARVDALAAKRALKGMRRRVNQRRPRDGVLAAYREVLGRAPPPTRYGRTHVRESFADALAMYHCQPDRLELILPRVHDWFARGGHVR